MDQEYAAVNGAKISPDSGESKTPLITEEGESSSQPPSRPTTAEIAGQSLSDNRVDCCANHWTDSDDETWTTGINKPQGSRRRLLADTLPNGSGDTTRSTYDDQFSSDTRSLVVNEEMMISIQRPAYNQVRFDARYDHLERDADAVFRQQMRRRLVQECSPRALWCSLLSFLPILQWLPKYNIRRDLFSDFIGGLTVGILHIPQGMAYASLAGLKPVYGLYTSFFPALFYMFFGTSRHVSLGVFAVVSLMVGGVRYRIVPGGKPPQDTIMLNLTEPMSLADSLTTVSAIVATTVDGGVPEWRQNLTAVQVVTALTLAVGLVQIAMAVLRLDFTMAFLSDQVVNGFTTGAACHVFTAQLNKVLGVDLPRYSGAGKLLFMYRDLIKQVPEANVPTVVVSIVTAIALVVGKYLIQPQFAKLTTIPLPVDLVVVIIATGVSYLASFHVVYGVHVVEYIPTGIPGPRLPEFRLLPEIMGDAVGIAVVIFVVTVSMGKYFARKHNYKIDPRQELYGLGCMEVLCSLFSVYPASTSLARSLVYEGAGTKTQLATVFSCGLLLTVLLWVGPLFEDLPMCVLGTIIIVALKGMFVQLNDLKVLWPVSKTDFLIWLVTFLATVFIDVREGLAVGVLFALFTVIYRTQRPHSAVLENMHGAPDIYQNGIRYSKTEQNSDIKIFRLEASLIFANSDLFAERLYRRFNIDIPAAQKELKKLNGNPEVVVVAPETNNNTVNHDEVTPFEVNPEEQPWSVHVVKAVPDEKMSGKDDTPTPCNSNPGVPAAPRPKGYPYAIILDCSPFNDIDVVGMDCLKLIYAELDGIGVKLILAECNAHVRDMFAVGGFYETVPKTTLYASLIDAFIIVEEMRQRDMLSLGDVALSTNL